MLENKKGYSAQQGISFTKGGGVGEGQLYSWYHAHTHNIPTFVFLP